MICPCGYDKECPIWCGNGHNNGMCRPYDATDPRSQAKLTNEHQTSKRASPATPENTQNKALLEQVNKLVGTAILKNDRNYATQIHTLYIDAFKQLPSMHFEDDILIKVVHAGGGKISQEQMDAHYRNNFREKLLAELEAL